MNHRFNRHIGKIIQHFPWNLCRKIYSDSANNFADGVSFDWEFLLSSAFIDAKCIISDWLNLKKLSKTESLDLEGIIAIAVDSTMKNKVLARAELFGKLGFYDMIASAFLYVSGIYAEEFDLLAVFTSVHKRNDHSKQVEYLSAPDASTLAKWLKEAVTLDIQSVPAMLLATISTANASEQGTLNTTKVPFTADIALQMLHEHFERRNTAETFLTTTNIPTIPPIAQASIGRIATESRLSGTSGLLGLPAPAPFQYEYLHLQQTTTMPMQAATLSGMRSNTIPPADCTNNSSYPHYLSANQTSISTTAATIQQQQGQNRTFLK